MEETDKEYKSLLALPGMKKEEVKTSIENHCLVVEGERKNMLICKELNNKEIMREKEEEGRKVLERECGNIGKGMR